MHVRFLFDDDRTDQPVLSFLATTRGARPTKKKTRRVVDAAKTNGSDRAVAQSAFQKPYSPSPGAGSLRTTVLETCSPDRSCTPTIGGK